MLTTHWSPLYFFKDFLNIFFVYYYLFLAVLGLCCCTQAISSCGERGLLFVAVCGPLIAMASRCEARALGTWASVVVADRLRCSVACRIFLDQDSKPCPLHWQVDS